MEELSEFDIYVALGIILVIGTIYAFYTAVAEGNAKDSKWGFIVWLIKDTFFRSKPDYTGSPSSGEEKDTAGGND